jgi:hypothetical protein
MVLWVCCPHDGHLTGTVAKLEAGIFCRFKVELIERPTGFQRQSIGSNRTTARLLRSSEIEHFGVHPNEVT